MIIFQVIQAVTQTHHPKSKIARNVSFFCGAPQPSEKMASKKKKILRNTYGATFSTFFSIRKIENLYLQKDYSCK